MPPRNGAAGSPDCAPDGDGADTACDPHNALTTGATASRRSEVRNNPWNTGPASAALIGGAAIGMGDNPVNGAADQAGAVGWLGDEAAATTCGTGRLVATVVAGPPKLCARATP